MHVLAERFDLCLNAELNDLGLICSHRNDKEKVSLSPGYFHFELVVRSLEIY